LKSSNKRKKTPTIPVSEQAKNYAVALSNIINLGNKVIHS
jgi:hypothetical protein